MTNEEAIEQLKSILETGVADADVLLYTEDYEAIDYAINSLAQKPCEDCISRQALRQKLREHYDFFVNAYGGFNNLSLNDKFRVDEITNCIAMVVNAPPVTPHPRWIPVSERLPESDDDVLVVDDAGGLASVGIDWFDIYNGRWVNSQNVTAWMPLPKPYERGESDAK